jgi:hypothetical protein
MVNDKRLVEDRHEPYLIDFMRRKLPYACLWVATPRALTVVASRDYPHRPAQLFNQ